MKLNLYEFYHSDRKYIMETGTRCFETINEYGINVVTKYNNGGHLISTGYYIPKYHDYYAINTDAFGSYKCRYLVRFLKDLDTYTSDDDEFGVEIMSTEPKIENIECYIWFNKGLIHRSNGKPAVLITNNDKVLFEEFWDNGKIIKTNNYNKYFVEHFLKNMKVKLVENKVYGLLQ